MTAGERRNPRLYAALVVTGAAALAFEVIWSRRLIPWTGGTARAQIATVLVYMIGLFIGAAAGAPAAAREEGSLRRFLRVEAGACVCAFAAIWILPWTRPLMARLSGGDLLSGDLGSTLRGI